LQATLLRKRSWSQAKYHPCIPEMTKGRIISKSPASWKANEPNLEDPNSSLAQKKPWNPGLKMKIQLVAMDLHPFMRENH
jgi:hypothetical protein